MYIHKECHTVQHSWAFCPWNQRELIFKDCWDSSDLGLETIDWESPGAHPSPKKWNEEKDHYSTTWGSNQYTAPGPHHPDSTSGGRGTIMAAWTPNQEPELPSKSHLLPLQPPVFWPKRLNHCPFPELLQLWECHLGARGCWCTTALTSTAWKLTCQESEQHLSQGGSKPLSWEDTWGWEAHTQKSLL